MVCVRNNKLKQSQVASRGVPTSRLHCNVQIADKNTPT